MGTDHTNGIAAPIRFIEDNAIQSVRVWDKRGRARGFKKSLPFLDSLVKLEER